MQETKKQGLLVKAGKLLRKFDNYGENASFLIKGESRENTVCGSLVSIVILVITFSYALQRLSVMKEFQDSTHIVASEPDVNNKRKVTQAESGFNFAIGLINSSTLKPEPIDTHGLVELSINTNEWEGFVNENGE